MGFFPGPAPSLSSGQTEASRIKFGSDAVYSDYVKIAKDSARELGVDVEVRQSNDEAEFVRWVRAAAQEVPSNDWTRKTPVNILTMKKE